MATASPPDAPVAPPTPIDGSQPLADAKHELFCLEYILDWNRNAASRRVGLTPRAGKHLWLRPEILARIEYLRLERVARLKVDADYVVANTVQLVEQAMGRVPVLLASGKHKIQPSAPTALAALTLLSKHTGGFAERNEHSGPGGGPIPVAVEDLRNALASRITGIASRIGAYSVHRVPDADGARRN